MKHSASLFSDAFVLSAALTVTIVGVDQGTAETPVRGAHAICPYSNAVKGHVDVQTVVAVR
jgi:lipoyl-dependent peroxiredoxin